MIRDVIQVKQQLSQYSSALFQMKVDEVKSLRGGDVTAAAVANLDSYFQLVLMSEVCEVLLDILQNRTAQSFFMTHNL